jgi:hypothetical protein
VEKLYKGTWQEHKDQLSGGAQDHDPESNDSVPELIQNRGRVLQPHDEQVP